VFRCPGGTVGRRSAGHYRRAVAPVAGRSPEPGMPDSRSMTEAPEGEEEPLIEVPTEAAPARKLPSRRVVTIITIPLIALVIVSYIGDAFMPALVDRHPVLLMAMNPRNRNLILVVNEIDAWVFYVVGTLRLIATDPLWFLIGYWYGDSALRWAERRTRTFGDTLRWFEKGFSKAAYPLVVIAPNNWICLFAGAAGMGVGTFFALNLIGTVGRLFLIRLLGDAFDSPIQWVLDLIADYRTPLLIFSIITVGILVAMEYRKGDSEISAIKRGDLEHGDRRGPDVAPGPGPGSGDKS
jgi:membrane protein DedA with SNARE-associated domain